MYAQEFPMDVHDGAQYLARNRASIGRTFATQVLEGKVGPNCCLLGSAEHSDMTLRQRAVLSHMRETTSNSEFDSALHAAMEFGALPSSARHVFAGVRGPPHVRLRARSPRLSGSRGGSGRSGVGAC